MLTSTELRTSKFRPGLKIHGTGTGFKSSEGRTVISAHAVVTPMSLGVGCRPSAELRATGAVGSASMTGPSVAVASISDY